MEELLKQQYQREEKTRLKNKQAERLLIHGIESKKGIRALHEYRLQIVNRQQKELARELERIQADMPQRKHRVVSKEASVISKESKRPSPRQSRSHWSSKTPHTRQTRTHSQPTTVHSSPTRRSSRNIYDDDFDNDSEDNDDDDEDDDDYSDDEDHDTKELGTVPDRDVLKAIMKSMVSDWERRASRAVEQHRRQSIAQLKEQPKTPEFYESSNTSVLGTRPNNYTGHKTSKWIGDSNKKRHSLSSNLLEGVSNNKNNKSNKNDDGGDDEDYNDNVKKKRGQNQSTSNHSKTTKGRNSNKSGTDTNSVESRLSRWRNKGGDRVGDEGRGGGGGGYQTGGTGGGRQGRIVVDKEGAHFLNEEASPSTGGHFLGSNSNGSQTFRGEGKTNYNTGEDYNSSLSKLRTTDDYVNGMTTKSSVVGYSTTQTSDKTGIAINIGGQESSPLRDNGGQQLPKSIHLRLNGKHSQSLSGQIDTFGSSRITEDRNNNADYVNGSTRLFRSSNNNSNNSFKNSNGLNSFPSGRSTREDHGNSNSLYSSRLDYYSNTNHAGNFFSETPVTARSTRSLPIIKDKKMIVASSPKDSWHQQDKMTSSSLRNQPPPPLSPVRSPPEVSSNLLRSHTGSPHNNVFSKHPKIHIYNGRNRGDGKGGGGGGKSTGNKKLKGRIIMKMKDTRGMFGGKSAPVGGNGPPKTVLSPLSTNPSNEKATTSSQQRQSDVETGPKRYNRHAQLSDVMSQNQ